MTPRQPGSSQAAFAALRRYGILLESDPWLPSVVALVAGRPVRGSWWGHPSGHAIYRVAGELAHHRDVSVAKLVSGKVTFIHGRFWPHLLAIGSAGQPWQLDSLSRPARVLLDLVSKRGSLRADDPAVVRVVSPTRPAAAALELQRRLLVSSSQVHTETGAHTKCLEAWDRWAHRLGIKSRVTVQRARADLDDVLDALNEQFDGKGRLPWWD